MFVPFIPVVTLYFFKLAALVFVAARGSSLFVESRDCLWLQWVGFSVASFGAEHRQAPEHVGFSSSDLRTPELGAAVVATGLVVFGV